MSSLFLYKLCTSIRTLGFNRSVIFNQRFIMERKKFIAVAGVEVKAPVEEIWKALTDSTLINKYLIDTDVKSTWEMGSDISWEGERDGTPYKDYGRILVVNPNKILSYSHFCPLSGREDVQENYHNIEIELMQNRDKTTVILTQDNNRSERSRDRSEKNWNEILVGLKKLVEGDNVRNDDDFLAI